MSIHRPALLACLLAVTAAGVQARDAQLHRSGGALGGVLTYELSGDATEVYVLMPSLTAGPTPLAIIDPADPRVMQVGWDLPHLWMAGVLAQGGEETLALTLPSFPGLHGVAIYAQFITLPGTTTTVDDLSNYTAFRLGFPQQSTYTVQDHLVEVEGHTATTLPDGRVLLAGGKVEVGGLDVALDGFYLFDPQTGAFAPTTGTMQVGRIGHTATLLSDGRVLLLGGADGSGLVSNTGDVWDPATGLASPTAPMAAPSTLHTATRLIDGRVFVAGGTGQFDLADPIGTVESALETTRLYDPTDDSWQVGPDLPKPRMGHNATLLDSGRVLISAGVEVASVVFLLVPAFSDDCRRYDPGSNALLDTADLDGARAYHGQTALSGGRALMVGGAVGNVVLLDFDTVATCQIYTESTDSWVDVASLTQPRANPNVLIANGRIWVLGGVSEVHVAEQTGTPATPIEESDLAASSWSSPDDTLLGRPLALSVLIEDGARILTTGRADDQSGGSVPDLTAEVFLP